MNSKSPDSTEHRIFRASDGPYFALRRKTAQDRKLSFEARGMLVYLLSKPVDWSVQPKDLQQCCGRNQVYRILNELIAAKYIVRTVVRNDKGQSIRTDYEVHEMPLPQNQEVGNQKVGNGHITDRRESQDHESSDQESNREEIITSSGEDVRTFDPEEEFFVSESAADEPKDVSPAPEKAKEPKPPQPHIAIIDAWAAAQTKPVGDYYSRNARVASSLYKAGYTPAQITEYLTFLKADKFWKGKLISLEYVAKNIASWIADVVKPQQAPAEPASPMDTQSLIKQWLEDRDRYVSKKGYTI